METDRSDTDHPAAPDPWSDGERLPVVRRLQEAAADGVQWLSEIGKPREPAIRRTIRQAFDAGDVARVDQVGRAAARRCWTNRQRMRIAQALAFADRSDLGLAMILAGRRTARLPSVLRVLGILLKHTRDPALKARLAETLERRTNGGRRVDRHPSPLAFPTADQRRITPGTAVFVASGSLPRRHAVAVEAAMERFRQRIIAPPRPKVALYRDVYIARSGMIWDREGRIIRAKSHPIPSFRPGSVPEIEDALDLVKGPRAGIYHWLVDRAPLLACVQGEGAGGVRVLIADDAPSFEAETMAMLGVSDRVLPVGDVLFVRRLHLASIGIAGMVRFGAIAPVVETLAQSAIAAAEREGLERPARIYVSRGDARRRPLLNEVEVEAAMRARGFAVVHFARIPLRHQIALAASASMIAGPHGAGLAHLMFARPGCRVAELLSLVEGYYDLRVNYARLSIARGLDYFGWGEPEPPGTTDWRVDVPAMLPRLDAFLDGPPSAAGIPVSREGRA